MSSSEKVPIWWKPTKELIESSNLEKFRKVLNTTYKINLETYEDIHTFSVERLEDFWQTFWQFSGIRANKKATKVLTYSSNVPKSEAHLPINLPKFFQDAQINLAENILFPLHPKNSTGCMPNPPKSWPHSNQIAIHEWGESFDGKSGPAPYSKVSWGELRDRVAILSTALRKKGLRSGDRIAHVSSNSSNPIVTFLASLSVGCIFSALPTDAGVQAIFGRLSQIRPKLLFTDDIALYNGKKVNVIDRVAEVCDQLAKDEENSKDSLLEVVCLINQREGTKNEKIQWKSKQKKCSSFSDFLASVDLKSDGKIPPLQFESLPFNHPALIVFSSGTTGEPKSICHSAGGLLLNGKKEGLFQYELKGTQDTFLQITTCGWIMWCAQTLKLTSGSSVLVYDGSPIYPNALVIPKIIQMFSGKLTGFGGSPRLLSEMERECKQRGISNLSKSFSMSTANLRIVTSTGSPLNPSNIKFFYESFVDQTSNSIPQLISISGGTDLAGCLLGSSCYLPVQGHLLASKSLALDVRICDPITGKECESTGEAGELMVGKPFPTQPLFFFGKDEKAMYEKYMESYYTKYQDGPAKGWWSQGDFISKHLEANAYEIHGRSDGVLNPSGVRFGSAEIYSVIESPKFQDFVLDSICVGQRRKGKDEDETVLLFIKCKPNQSLNQNRKQEISLEIKKAFSARHVPKYIFQVKDIPVTANGKKTELAIKAIVSGKTDFKPSSAIANPEALDEYRQYAEIEKVVEKENSSSRSSKL